MTSRPAPRLSDAWRAGGTWTWARTSRAQLLVELAVGGDLGDDLLGRLVGQACPDAARAPSQSATIAGSGFTPSLSLVGRLYAHTTARSAKLGAATRCGGASGRASLMRIRTTRRRSMSENTTTEINAVPRPAHRRRAARSGLDVMLTDAAVRRPAAVHRAGRRRSRSAPAWRAHPRRVANRAAGLAGRARTRRPRAAPSSRPPRATGASRDPAWEGNWLLRRLLQGYLAVGETVDGLIDDADVDWRAERRARLAAGNVLDALAPTNFAWSNPTVIKETVDTGGEQPRPRRPAARPRLSTRRRGCRRPSTRASSRSAATSRRSLDRSCCAPRCSS